MPATKRKTGTGAARKKAAGAAKKKASTAKKAKSAATKPAAKKAAPGKARTAAKPKAARSTSAAGKSAARAPRQPKARVESGRGAAAVDVGPIRGFEPYQPRKGEEYMNERQLEHFRQILLAWKRELMEEVDRTVHHMQDEAGNFPDPNDRATQEEEFSLELRTRDRERKLIRKIDEALARIENGEYGYCESCGVEIGIRRLEARPTATLCIDCKTLDEVRERQMGL